MKYENNKIVYEFGDWVTVVGVSGSFSKKTEAIGHCFPIVGDVNSFNHGDEFAIDGENKFHVNYTLSDVRPATQQEINKAMAEEKIMVGEHEVKFMPCSGYIMVGCVQVTRDLFLKIGKRAGWL